MPKEPARRLAITPGEYRAFSSFLQSASGIRLGEGREYLVSSRLGGLLADLGLGSLDELLARLKGPQGVALRGRVIDAMTTNETFWFRDAGHFSWLRERLLPELLGQSGGRLRIWSAACSTGQEPYNLSMVVEDLVSQNQAYRRRPVEILATDLSSRVLEEARRGRYCGYAVDRGLSAEQQARYFTRRDDCIEVRPELKQRVRFRPLNLTDSFTVLGRFDIIFCRNVLIYFSSDLKRDIVDRMADQLNPGGYLLLGSTESISHCSDRFEMQLVDGSILYRLKS